MLTCLYGRAGAGKTARILDEVVCHGEHLREAILIVPEQYTFSAERILMEKIASHGLLTVQVLSPSRLAHRVLSAAQEKPRRLLDAAGTQMVFTRILRENKGDLRYYGRMQDVHKLAALMHDLVRSLKQADLTPDAFAALVQPGTNPALCDKVHDIAKIYRAYEAYLDSASLADGASLERRLIDALPQADFLQNACIYADSFDLIAPLTLRMLAVLSAAAKEVTVTFPCADGVDEALFAPVRQSMHTLARLARDKGVQVKLEEIAAPAHKNAALMHLEKTLFAVPASVFEGDARQIVLVQTPGVQEEAAMTAGMICALAREKGIHYGEMAVVCAAGSARMLALSRQLSMRGVPNRIDKTDTAAQHPAVKALLGALLSAHSGLTDRQALLRVVKCGYTGVDEDDLDVFENAVMTGGVMGARFLDEMEDARAETVRQRVVLPIYELLQLLKPMRTAQEYAAAAYSYLKKSGILLRLCEKGENQAAQVLVSVLDQSHSLMGEMPLRAYLEVLQSGFSQTMLGEIPQLSDAVSITTFDRFKGDRIRAMVIMGCESGVLPSSEAPPSLLSDLERDALGAYLGPGGRQYFALENLTIYAALTQAQEYLILTQPLLGAQGEELASGEIFRRVERIFPGAQKIAPEDCMQARWLLTDESSLKTILGPMLRKSRDPLWRGALKYLESRDPVSAQRIGELYAFRPEKQRILPEQARELFGLRQSISRLESYASCPFEHFMRYGLHPQVLYEPQLLPPDAGTFYHEALDRFTRILAPGGFAHVTQEEARRVMESVTTPLCEALMSRAFARTACGRAQIHAMAKTAIRAGQELVWHVQNSAFVPQNSEISFGMGGRYPAIELKADDMRLVLQGKIDRVDQAIIGGEKYLRIVDYKTGRNQLSFARVESGTQLQLLTYLDAVTRLQDARSAGAFYMKITGSLTGLAGEMPDAQQTALLRHKTFGLAGLANENSAVLEAMAPGGLADTLIGVRLTKNGVPYANAPVVSEEQLKALCAYVHDKARTLSRRVISGDIEPTPLKVGQFAPCDFCRYRAACAFDPELGGQMRRCASKESDAKARVLEKGMQLIDANLSGKEPQNGKNPME